MQKVLTQILKLSLYCFVALLTLPVSLVSAANEFSTSYSTTYSFDTLGSADISHTIELTNNLSHIYPTEYTIAISSSDLKDLRVKVGEQATEFSQDQTTTLTTVHIPIKNASIGKGQTTRINLSYRSNNLAEKIGNTYTITLPRTQKGNEASSFTRTLHVPSSFPPLKLSSLTPQTETTEDGVRSYSFVGGGGESLTALFGDSVTYNLSLTYILKNTSAATGTTEIALPPDTPYQRVLLKEIKPAPSEMVVDSDGNWLARYNISSLEKKTVTANIQIEVDPEPIYFDPSTNLPVAPEIYWEQGSSIKNLGRQLKSPKNIYQYLLDTFTYDYSAISNQKRLGAEAALKSPTNTICTEFTDTFVALTRAQGIPSRSIIGYAYTSDPSLRPKASSLDVLHAYPEYYDAEHKIWRAVDPTWGHTTGSSSYFDRLDFSHIAFVRWGSESSYPLPPGSYRGNTGDRQIDITVSPEKLQLPKEPKYKIDKIDEVYYVINTGQSAIIRQNLEVEGRDVHVPYVPPYGRFRIQLEPSTNPIKYLRYTAPLLLVIFIISLIYRKSRSK